MKKNRRIGLCPPAQPWRCVVQRKGAETWTVYSQATDNWFRHVITLYASMPSGVLYAMMFRSIDLESWVFGGAWHCGVSEWDHEPKYLQSVHDLSLSLGMY